MATRNLLELLRLLESAGVEFVLIGGMAAVLRGAPVVTADIDIVHNRTPINVQRLLAVLRSIGAVARNDRRNLCPSESHLLGPGRQLLSTTHGPLDVLGEVSGMRYTSLLAHSTEMKLDATAAVQVVDLAMLIDLKRRAGRPKDLAALPVLEATLRLTR